jgi:hypothetical protein
VLDQTAHNPVSTVYAAIELSKKSWIVAITQPAKGPAQRLPDQRRGIFRSGHEIDLRLDPARGATWLRSGILALDHSHSNRLSSNQSLRFRETEFSSQRLGGREGSEAFRTALQRQNLLQQPTAISPELARNLL